MDNKHFNELTERIFDRIRKLGAAKGDEYTMGNEDRLFNFKNIAKECGVRPLQAWLIFFNKHYASVANYVKNKPDEATLTEPIEERLLDIMVYALLGTALIQEERKQSGENSWRPWHLLR